MKGGIQVGTIKFDKPGKVWEAYLERMKHFDDEVDEYYAYIHDSSTFAELAVRAYLTGVMRVKDNQMIWGQATDELERFYSYIFPDLPITTVVISHCMPETVRDGDDTIATGRMSVRLPGRLKGDLYASFGEIYRPYVTVSRRDTEAKYLIQTRQDTQWRCQSQLQVPNPMEPHWKHVFKACKDAGIQCE